VSGTRRLPPTPAAGGVVWRQNPLGQQVALVHRPRYDDWTLPKGKLDTAEPAMLAAVREVREELGSEVVVGRRLTTVEYPIGLGAAKRVSYWSMRHLRGQHEPSNEVDEICWLTVAEAAKRLTYPVDRVVLSDFARLPAETSTLLLLRHAKAGRRSDFRGDDRQRPLDKIGRRQARDAGAFLSCFAPERIIAADRVRCQQTVSPLADRLSLPIEVGPEFSDEACLADPDAAVKSAIRLAEQNATTVVCSQGKAIPLMMADLDTGLSSPQSRKGSVWALSFWRGSVIAADYYPHPGT